jgi:hypothetical protein
LRFIHGIGADQPLGQVERLDQKKPVVVRGRERLVGPAVHRARRRDVEHGQLRHRVRMIEAQPVRDTAAAIVADETEPRMSEIAHQLDHVLRHRALRVRRVLAIGRRLAGIAIAAKIGADNRVVAGERWRHPMPAHVRLRIAVQ